MLPRRIKFKQASCTEIRGRSLSVTASVNVHHDCRSNVTLVAKLMLLPIAQELSMCGHGVFMRRMYVRLLECHLLWNPFAVVPEVYINAYPDKDWG
jgi:hypothetical protein